MALTPDFAGRIIHSDASITDVVAFHLALRDIEDDAAGILHPMIHTYKAVDLGGGATFPAVAFVNGWTLQFPAGNWLIKGGNVSATINPVAGAFVLQTQSAAYAVTAVGGSAVLTPAQDAKLMSLPTAASNAAEVLSAAQTTPIHADMRKTNGQLLVGNGTEGDKFRSSLV